MKKPRHYRGGFEYSGSLKQVRQLRRTSTDAETLLWNSLRNRQLLGFKFRRQHQLGNYIVDFYCNEAKLVIECDGTIHSKAEVWHHDQVRDAYMASSGLKVLRFSNQEIFNQMEAVLSVISKYLREAKPKATLPHPNPLPEGEGVKQKS